MLVTVFNICLLHHHVIISFREEICLFYNYLLYITCGECDYPLLKMPDEGVAP